MRLSFRDPIDLYFHNIRQFIPFQVEEYKNGLITKAENLILKGFPEKIIQLNELLETPMFCNRDFDEVYQGLDIPVPDPVPANNNHAEEEPPPTKRMKRDAEVSGGTKVMAISTGIIKCNTPICEIIKVVKPVIRTLVEDCKGLNFRRAILFLFKIYFLQQTF